MSTSSYRAAILDLDGVITQTARLHAQAWKQIFDAYLEARDERPGEDHAPFGPGDYDEYVDGKPRYDGIRSFLESRGIRLPEGDREDAPDEETIFGLGNRKNEILHALLDEHGVDVYEDALEQIQCWRKRGLHTAVISSSRNCEAILTAADLHHLFDVKVDGVDSERLGLQGKPAPDIFYEAARQLGVNPSAVMVFEAARAGVEAGSVGELGLVVGVARAGEGDALRAHGADIVVRDLRDADDLAGRPGGGDHVPSALRHITRITQRLGDRRLVLVADYDGTLTPMADRPEAATLADATRVLLERIAQRDTVVVISGRDLDDDVVKQYERLRKRGGNQIFELQPDVPWDEGRALTWLLDTLGLDRGDVIPIYLGDDASDEEAFRALGHGGIGIYVGQPTETTRADFALRDVEEVKLFLRALLERQ